VKKVFDWLLSKLPETHLEDDDTRIHTQFIIVFFVLSIVSSFMTFLNYLTSWNRLAQLTLLLAIVCLISLIIEVYAKSRAVIITGRILFASTTCAVFLAFAIVGEPEGFSILWSLLLPTCGFFLFRRKYGSIIGFVLFTLLAILFWTPFGNSFLMYGYTTTFKQRFPILYFSFFIIGYIFEFVRFKTQQALAELKDEYEQLYNHDMLTGLYNRYGFNSTFNEFLKNRNGHKYAFAIIDLDFFKKVNDTYGHQAGDAILTEVAKRIKEGICPHCIASRWGGEEFAILFTCEEDVESRCKAMVERQRTDPIKFGDVELIIKLSMGIIFIPKDEDADMIEVVKMADDNLYEAKHTGRDKYVYSEYSKFKKFVAKD